MTPQVSAKNRMFVGVICGFLSLLLMVRGVRAIVYVSFEATTRYSGPYQISGAPAQWAGGTYVCFGIIVLSAVLLCTPCPKRVALLVGGAGLVGAVLCAVMRFLG